MQMTSPKNLVKMFVMHIDKFELRAGVLQDVQLVHPPWLSSVNKYQVQDWQRLSCIAQNIFAELNG